MRAGKPNAIGTIRISGPGLCSVEVSSKGVERVAAFLDSLARLLDSKGIPVQATDEGVTIKRAGDAITFSLKEKTRRQKHEPTIQELEAEAKRERRRQQHWAGTRHGIDLGSIFDRSYPEFDTIHTGAFVFEIEGYDPGIRRSWADGKTQTVETLVNSIVDGVETILVFRRAERQRREEQERKWNELCRRRDLAKRRIERERQRLGYWRKIARTQREIDVLRRWLTQSLIEAGPPAAPNVCRMIDWTKMRLAALEQSVAVNAVDRILANGNLFPEVDDLIDPLGAPPREPQYYWQM